jgi:hypothetical protein
MPHHRIVPQGRGDTDPHNEELPVNLDDGCVVLDVLQPEWDVLIEIQEALCSSRGDTQMCERSSRLQ